MARTGDVDRIFVYGDDAEARHVHPFFECLNQILAAADFDEAVWRIAKPNIVANDLPLQLVSYFRCVIVGYFEGLDSFQDIAWRCADSASIRRFIGCGDGFRLPTHRTLESMAARLDAAAHVDMYGLLLRMPVAGKISEALIALARSPNGCSPGMKSIIRPFVGDDHLDFLGQLLCKNRQSASDGVVAVAHDRPSGMFVNDALDDALSGGLARDATSHQMPSSGPEAIESRVLPQMSDGAYPLQDRRHRSRDRRADVSAVLSTDRKAGRRHSRTKRNQARKRRAVAIFVLSVLLVCALVYSFMTLFGSPSGSEIKLPNVQLGGD